MSGFAEADEAQRGHYNDGFSPFTTQSTAADPDGRRQSQHSRHRSQHSVRHRHFQYSIPSPQHTSHDPYQQQQPRVVSPLHETSSAIPPPSSSSQPMHDYVDEVRRTPTSSSHLQSRDAQADNIGAGEMPLSQGKGVHSGTDDALSWIHVECGTPHRVPRRYKTLKKVELFHGNFVFDSAVSSKLLDMCPLRNEREFTHMRYSAATCDPNDFKDNGFTLRQVHYGPPRRTELFICMTMYNEDEELFCRSMHGVITNIAHLCKRDRSKTWGKEAWKKVVVCIVSDGRQEISPRTLSVIATMGAYQEGIAKSVVDGKPVTAHIYEYTTQISVTPSMEIENAEKGIIPVQLIFCIKEKAQKKINSHRWFFNAFGPILQPNVCVLLDVGTMPGPTSIYHLWKTFDTTSNIGGACGEIVAMKGKYGETLLNPLVAAQNFEYKMLNILEKPLESVFGCITVLPSAFSAYRYIALQNDANGEGPLQKYFLGEHMHGGSADILTANMNLAEDRILCWELASKRGASWNLHYVKSAYALTAVPDSVPELISLRWRRPNGSFFAAVYNIVHFHYIYRSSHSFLRKFWIHIGMFYQLYSLIFSWFALGNFYIAFVILTNTLEGYLPVMHYLNLVFNYFYLGLLIMCFLLSLCDRRPQDGKRTYTLALLGFSLIALYMTVSASLLTWKGVENVAYLQGRPIQLGDFLANSIFRNIDLALVVTLGLYVISSLLCFDPWHMVTSFPQYLLMVPSYIAVLNVYTIANIHDVSWETKDDINLSADFGIVSTGKDANRYEAQVDALDERDSNAAYEDALHVLSTKPPTEKEKVDPKLRREDHFKAFRTNVLLTWTLSNGLLAAIVISAIPRPGSEVASTFANVYMSVIVFTIAGLTFVRFVGCVIYLLVRLFVGE